MQNWKACFNFYLFSRSCRITSGSIPHGLGKVVIRFCLGWGCCGCGCCWGWCCIGGPGRTPCGTLGVGGWPGLIPAGGAGGFKYYKQHILQFVQKFSFRQITNQYISKETVFKRMYYYHTVIQFSQLKKKCKKLHFVNKITEKMY